MITVIGGGLSGLSTAYFLHRAGTDVTVLEWSRGLGGRAGTRNLGYRTMDAGTQRIDLSPHSSNKTETQARATLKRVFEERGILPHLLPFPGPTLRFDGRSIGTAKPVEGAEWSYIDGGMRVIAEALIQDIPVRTHTRISDIIVDGKSATLRNQRGEKMPTDGVVLALPAPYALAMLLPHLDRNKKLKKLTDQINEVQYELMIGAAFGTTKLKFNNDFTTLFSDDVTAPIFWLSQEERRRSLGVRKDESAFMLQLGAEISRDYVLKSDRETFAAIERVFEEVLDIALPDITYGEIQRWPAAFLESSPFAGETPKAIELGVPLYVAGDYVVGQSSIASAFWSGKLAADAILGEDSLAYISAPKREQAAPAEGIWAAPIPPARAPHKPKKRIKPKRDPKKDKKRKRKMAQNGRFRDQRGRPGGRPGYGRPGYSRGGGYQQRGGGYGDRGGYGRQGGGYGQREGGGYGNREGGYAPREGGYGARQGGGYGGGQRPQRSGGYGGAREGGYAPRQGGYQSREGGYQPREGGGQGGRGGYGGGRSYDSGGQDRRQGGYNQRPQQGGGGYGGQQSGGYGGQRQGGYRQDRGPGGPPREQNFNRAQPGEAGAYRPRQQSQPGGGYQPRGGYGGGGGRGGYTPGNRGAGRDYSQGGDRGGYQGGGNRDRDYNQGGDRGGYQGGGNRDRDYNQGGDRGGYQGGGNRDREYNQGGGDRGGYQGGNRDRDTGRPVRGVPVYSTGVRRPNDNPPQSGSPYDNRGGGYGNQPPRGPGRPNQPGNSGRQGGDQYGQRSLNAEEEERKNLAKRRRSSGDDENAGNG